MSTARDIITLSFKEAGVLGVGQSLLAEDTNDGYDYLRQMMAQWQARRWLVPSLTTVNALGNSAVSNTIGPGGHWDVGIRPDQIQSGYVIQQNTGLNPVSLPLRQVFSRENYNLIGVKDLNTLPRLFFYDNSWEGGFGNVYVWPIPNAQYRVYLSVKAYLNFPELDEDIDPNGLDTVFDLPPEYEEAIRLNLAIRICSAYGKMPKPTTVGLAKVSLATIKTSNAQISQLQMPDSLRRGKAFDIWNADGY